MTRWRPNLLLLSPRPQVSRTFQETGHICTASTIFKSYPLLTAPLTGSTYGVICTGTCWVTRTISWHLTFSGKDVASVLRALPCEMSNLIASVTFELGCFAPGTLPIPKFDRSSRASLCCVWEKFAAGGGLRVHAWLPALPPYAPLQRAPACAAIILLWNTAKKSQSNSAAVVQTKQLSIARSAWPSDYSFCRLASAQNSQQPTFPRTAPLVRQSFCFDAPSKAAPFTSILSAMGGGT